MVSLKKCPLCAEWIQKDAIKCKVCGSFLSDYVPPPLPLSNPRHSNNNNTAKIISVVAWVMVGIPAAFIAFILLFSPYVQIFLAVIAIITGIVGFVLYKKRKSKKFLIAGIAGFAFCPIFSIFAIGLFSLPSVTETQSNKEKDQGKEVVVQETPKPEVEEAPKENALGHPFRKVFEAKMLDNSRLFKSYWDILKFDTTDLATKQSMSQRNYFDELPMVYKDETVMASISPDQLIYAQVWTRDGKQGYTWVTLIGKPIKIFDGSN